MIKVINDSVVNMDVEAIVNAANTSLAGGGGVDGAIHAAAGDQLYKVCADIGHCAVGDAVITPGFNLKAKYIIHTVGPIYSYFDKKSNETLLRSCYINTLKLANIKDIKSIAFPGISTGVYGYPLNEAVPIAINTVKDWLEKNNSNIDVWFCCYTKEEYDVYKQILK